jgi:NADH-quinone oxidoreductase subunit J
MAPLRQSLLSALAVLAGATLTLMVILGFVFIPNTIETAEPTVRDIGLALVSYQRDGYALPFEVISILLLAAMIGAIVVAKKEKITLPKPVAKSENPTNDSSI